MKLSYFDRYVWQWNEDLERQLDIARDDFEGEKNRGSFKIEYEIIYPILKKYIPETYDGFPFIFSWARKFIKIMQMDKEKRIEFDRKANNHVKQELKEGKKILEMLLKNELLRFELDIDEERLKKSLYDIKKTIKNLKGLRAGYQNYPNFYLWFLFSKLEELKIGQVKQINLIYDLLSKFNIEDFGKGSFEKEQKERIRKWQENLLKEPSPF